MAADYGINMSVQTRKRRRNEFELYGRIVHKKPTRIYKRAFNSTQGIFRKVPIFVI